jgi:hypothetical protein
VLWALPAGHLEDGPPRVGAEAAGDRAGEVVGPAQRRAGAGDRVLELTGRGNGVDLTGVEPAVGEGGAGGVGGQVDRRAPAVVRTVQQLGGLTHADHHGRTGIEVVDV